ncbi:phenazine biosynthesis protein PhzF family [Fodinibius roseus]|uniref:Phenazine biosynthesis protein PhzF family n=1 Tax=Fodinibius roseus TaxID=1194090 RepID=A0A1M5L5B6_9BACT|nr:PhzF family phenazine biosynthesis protein [Fodinibius roseus]SHG59603.1 phenazine biosynthesis protein PhzF family [Fodinibius roseus]
MSIKTYIIDAFTTELFKGNQAAVCLLQNELSKQTMLEIAKEFGYSETAFVLGLNTNSFYIRYFSPSQEIPLCGHATLASSKALFTEYKNLSKITFHTHFDDTLKISQNQDQIEMYFPQHGTEKSTVDEDIKRALGINEVLNCEYNSFHNIVMLEIGSSEVLKNLAPIFSVLRNIETSINGVLVTAQSEQNEYDYEYRYFFPWSGADEDPATGGVQSFLSKYWAKKLNKKKMKAYQSSTRTGSMEIELIDDSVVIRSNAVIFSSGELHLQD